MALTDILALSSEKGIKKIGISEDRIREQIPNIRKQIAF